MTGQRQGGFLVAKIHRLGGRIFARLLKGRGVDQLTPAQGRIMLVLWQEDGIPIRELARRTQLDKSTLTSMLDRLEEAGLLRRIPSQEDRRQIILRLSQTGRDLESLYREVSHEMTSLFYAGFTDEEVTRLEAGLERILGNLEAHDAKPRSAFWAGPHRATARD
jgi:DNA-binding MarR family transcriptional regulator